MEHVAATTVPLVTGGTRPSEFETTQKFKSKEDLIKWARAVGRLHGCVIITFKSDSGKANKKARVILACERSGKCDSRSTSTKGIEGKSKRRHTGTKKCECPFRLRGKKLEVGDEWELMVVQGMHNHLLHDTEKQGHSFQGRLSQEEKLLLKDLCDKGKKPKEILRVIQEGDGHNKSSSRTISNACQSLKRGRRLEEESIQDNQYVNCGLQQLMSKAEEYNFIVKHRIRPKTDTVLDFFVTHPTGLELLLAFPTVLMILFAEFGNPKGVVTLGIYGYTPLHQWHEHRHFKVGWAILSSSKSTSRYEWALTSLRGVISDYGIAMPDIVTFGTRKEDPIEVALIKAIKNVFNTAKLLLSRSSIIRHVFDNHIGPDIDEFIGLNGEEEDYCELFEEHWELLVESPSEADVKRNLKLLSESLFMCRHGLDYVEHTLLKSPYKQMFVAAWADQVMHFGVLDDEICHWYTGYHFGRMKEFLKKCEDSVVKQTDMDEFWKGQHDSLMGMYSGIKASFVESLTLKYNDRYRLALPELEGLHGAISLSALYIISRETMRANEIEGDDHGDHCGCTTRSTHGLPCAHEIVKYKRQGQPVPLECIHSFWRKLDLKPLRKTREPSVESGRMRLSEQMNTDTHSAISMPHIVESERNSPNAGPSVVPSTHERQVEDEVYHDIQPTKQLDEEVLPRALRSYRCERKDVPRDGHCGFRAIASFMGYNEEDNWRKVREDLRKELMIEKTYYSQLFGWERVYELNDALAYFESSYLPKKYWMTMPDMGHIIASCYSVVLVHLSSDQCFTFFPFKTEPTPSSVLSTREIVIGYHREHFYQVYLEEGHPMPPPVPAPTKKRIDVALATREQIYEQRSVDWALQFSSRIKLFKSLQTEVVPQKNPSLLHIDSSPINSV